VLSLRQGRSLLEFMRAIDAAETLKRREEQA
jgi:hypothetical protein